MKARRYAALSSLALALALAPLSASAGSGPAQKYTLVTREIDELRGGELDGRLSLNVSPDGIVSGTFRDSSGHIAEVGGGMEGIKIWLQFGPGAGIVQRYFNGTLIDGELLAHAPTTIHSQWTLKGTPAKH